MGGGLPWPEREHPHCLGGSPGAGVRPQLRTGGQGTCILSALGKGVSCPASELQLEHWVANVQVIRTLCIRTHRSRPRGGSFPGRHLLLESHLLQGTASLLTVRGFLPGK